MFYIIALSFLSPRLKRSSELKLIQSQVTYRGERIDIHPICPHRKRVVVKHVRRNLLKLPPVGVVVKGEERTSLFVLNLKVPCIVRCRFSRA